MKRRRRITWKHCVGVIISLAAVIGVAAAWLIRVETKGAIADAEYESHLDAMGFAQIAEAWADAQAAEAWINVEARQSFTRVIDTMLLGTAAYVQVVFGNAVLIDSADESWSANVPLLIAVANEMGSATIHSVQGQLLADVVVPIGTQERGETASYARVGYELAALTHHLKTIRLAGAGIAFTVFLVSCFFSVLVQAWLDHQGFLLSPFGDIARTLAAHRADDCLVLDEHTKQVALHGKSLFLPPKPFQLLSLLVGEEGRVLQESEIVETLWPEADFADSRDIRQCVYLLRKRLDTTVAGASACIANVKGFGYRYDAASLKHLRVEQEAYESP